VATCRAIIADLRAKSANAAERGKPTRWAYYGDLADALEAYFSDVTPTDGGHAGAALALSGWATRACPGLTRTDAAHLWALGVYARRILAAWGAGSETVRLDWLRARASERRPQPVALAALEALRDRCLARKPEQSTEEATA
jgi:hypothetical protein